MSEQDNDLLDAFLVEAGELLDGLSEQLIELESNPTESELLNAVFRAFHTVKGGAGFLGATQMVGMCHHAEDLLNDARNGRVVLTPDDVDALLQALDLLQAMMAAMARGEPLQEPPAELMQRLQNSASSATPAPPSMATDKSPPPPAASAASDTHTVALTDPVNDAFDAMLDGAYEQMDGSGTGGEAEPITDSEFESLLDELHGSSAPGTRTPPAPPAPVDDSIGDDEFESLLDELHGSGKAPGTPSAPESDAIDDSEFEALLDQLYGTGKAPGQKGENEAGAENAADKAPSAPEPAAPASTPAAAGTMPATVTSSPEPAPTRVTPVPKPASDMAAAPKAAAGGSAHHAETTVRVDTTRLDSLVNAAGELILVRNRLANLSSRGVDPAMERAINELDRVADNLQNAALRMRMQPIGRLFQRFPRIIRDLARQLGKDVELVQEGEETNLDRTLVESLADPLIHLLRNAVDHGLEDPTDRESDGKPRKGTVRLSAGQEGERIIIRISDDGRGMNPDVLRRKAVEKGLLDEERAAQLEDSECYELIFAPGFSTREEISNISGRGVGMDVVKTSVAELGGTIGIESKIGHGTTVRISIPLTLAILRVLMVRVGSRLMALPMSNVKEVFELTPGQVRELDGGVVAAHRGKPLPLSDLGQWAGVDGGPGNRHVVLLHIGHQHLGCVVHEVLGREEVMIKPLGRLLHHLPGIAGATITGDGRIALVLDLVALTSDTPLPSPLRASA
ncbi:chemotaxis protein CheA [Oleiagrimonas sp. C23AA]|uniref:chemotaxis protein CheA n=1 Tax=Oleiagrimonas sp. C23AA TaxID=2719047 RepID=UPI0014230EF9|nr:chemotaxis protein CheA [Oleiagrimonas sp. C23AA]NII09174.1 chemotaxis protein CheA [Oleiagrimonas sp. C23AA]